MSFPDIESEVYFPFPCEGQIFTHKERREEYVVTWVTGMSVSLKPCCVYN